MRRAVRGVRIPTFTYAPVELAAVALLAAVVSVWLGVAAGSFSFRALLACEALFLAFYAAGSFVASFTSLAAGLLFDFPLRLLFGYVAVNTALLVLAWVSPLGIVANFAVLLAVLACLLAAARERKALPRNPAALWLAGIAVVATTLWCQDSLSPTETRGDTVHFKPWVDGFYHAVHIRIFAASHGAATIEDFRLAEIPARLYHYGVYLAPAFVKQASGVHSYAVFAGLLAPVGILFTGLAAYAFFGSLWGPWPGFAAAGALLLFADGAQQGFENQFMSYHWLTQISPSATYGLALIAVAWLLVVKGCSQGSRVQLLAGWFVAGVTVMYKLHYVVASALLLLLVPVVFFRGNLGARRRVAWALAAVAVYGVCLKLGQRVPGVPPLRFDGSGAGEILRLIQTFALPGALKDFAARHMGPEFSLGSNLLFGVPYVTLTAFGVFAPLLVALVFVLRRRLPKLELLFPLLVLVNFLAMFFGLALDFDRSTPDELSHRPLMMVYFFVVAWLGGALALVLLRSRCLRREARTIIIGAAVLLLAVPASFGPDVQLMWAMPRTSPLRVPAALVRVAEYLREHGGPEDVFQDSQFDRTYVIGALSERRPFVAHTMTSMPFRSDLVATRTAAVDRLMALDDPKLVVGTARAYGLRWFILHAGNRVAWPPAAGRPVLVEGPFSVYEF